MHVLLLFPYCMPENMATLVMFRLWQQCSLVSVNLGCDAASLADW